VSTSFLLTNEHGRRLVVQILYSTTFIFYVAKKALVSKMADSPLVVQSCLCFLVNKFSKLPIRQLKSMTVDFYDVEEIVVAKEQLLSDVVGMKLNVDLPHIPRRRDGELMATRTVEDLLSVLTFLDENLKLN